METRQTTVRLPTGLADRLRRAHYLSKRSQNDIIIDALSHWLINPRRPGCTHQGLADREGARLAGQAESEGGA